MSIIFRRNIFITLLLCFFFPNKEHHKFLLRAAPRPDLSSHLAPDLLCGHFKTQQATQVKTLTHTTLANCQVKSNTTAAPAGFFIQKVCIQTSVCVNLDFFCLSLTPMISHEHFQSPLLWKVMTEL